MAIPSSIAIDILRAYRGSDIENLFAQSSASFVLYEVGESQQNFPRFDSALVDKVTMLAYSILAAGVSLAERELSGEALAAIEEAAVLLNNVHSPHSEIDVASSFHVLIAAMAFHASGQYSRAFVCMRKVETQTDLAAIISSFIRKQPAQTIAAMNPYLLEDLSEFTDPWALCDHSITLTVSRALSLFLEYFATGKPALLEDSLRYLDISMELAEDYESPAHWWIARLLRLMVKGNGEASLWQVLPPYLPGDKDLLQRYIGLLAYARNSVTELWRSQREAIPIALSQDSGGAVVNMRTSSGKTRVAELAILQILQEDRGAKILYLAPFRSLALEIEQTLGQIFDCCGFSVSHLYGGFRLSSTDRQLFEDSTIAIATPEKARALLRTSPELFAAIKLIIVDEGHLVGASDRYIKNELFVDHLRILAKSRNCRMLMLSAVLPNPGELAEWLTGDASNVARSDWKPSSERFGILRWQRNRVRIDWKGEFESFNPKFIQAETIRSGKRRKLFPCDKKEAVAATAVRLATVGPVMIFSARANSIPGLAKAVLIAMGSSPQEFPWPSDCWGTFLATCEEELSENAIELKAARHGVICHSNKLPSQVRMATERLMRSLPPKIIIASTTLAQGVNVGISSVIVSTPYQSSQPINHRDFWNICGRAGRAFVDGEGKVLFAIDETRKSWQIKKDRKLAASYFNREDSHPVESGLLSSLEAIYQIAKQTGVDFDHLMEMVAENDFSELGAESATQCSEAMDLIDDSLLSLHEDLNVNPYSDEPEIWADTVFRSSLAAIQADCRNVLLDKEGVINFIATRAKYVLDSTPVPAQRKAYVSSGLPISAASTMFRDLEKFSEEARILDESGIDTPAICAFLEVLEEWARTNATHVVVNLCAKQVLDKIRLPWIAGIPMREIAEETSEADSVCKDVYGYQLPWLIHAIAQQFKQIGKENLSETLAKAALLVELGLPSEMAAWFFLAGVHSRSSATELAAIPREVGNSLRAVRRKLRDPDTITTLRELVSPSTQAWLDLYRLNSVSENVNFPPFPRFILEGAPDIVLVRSHQQKVYLCSPDGRRRLAVKASAKFPFDRLANDYRFAFQRAVDNAFDLIIRDPKIEIRKTN